MMNLIGKKEKYYLRFRLDIRKRFFMEKAFRHLNLPKEVVTASILPEFKKCLVNTLRLMVWLLSGHVGC